MYDESANNGSNDTHALMPWQMLSPGVVLEQGDGQLSQPRLGFCDVDSFSIISVFTNGDT
jgi:hypothetical protein